MDFEDCVFGGSIPAGLTKTVTRIQCTSRSEESSRAATYYKEHTKVDGNWWDHMFDPIDPKHIELRVVSFSANRSQ
jgi:hypothetical protein